MPYLQRGNSMYCDTPGCLCVTSRVNRATILVLVCLVVLCPKPCLADDVVIVSTGKDNSGRMRRKGSVVNYTGEGLILRLSNGREIKIPSDRVIGIETERTEAHRTANGQLALGNYAKAGEFLAAALSDPAESRIWIKHEMLAALVTCQWAIGRRESACRYFEELVRQDPHTPFLEVIPIAWTPTDQVNRARAAVWLSAPEPAMRLLGASYLIVGPQRNAALSVLGHLRESNDVRIAKLATAQQWRSQVTTASIDNVAKWAETINQLPEPLRPGPYYVMGRALVSQKQHPQAAVALMHVPILYPHQPRLAAESLLEAGKSLSQIDRSAEATRLYREVISDYQHTSAATEARQRLDELSANLPVKAK